MKIFKYPLKITDVQTVKIPTLAKFLSVIEQRDQPVLYYLIDEENKDYVENTYRIFGTGHTIEYGIDYLQFLGTVSTYGGGLIWHIFKEKK